MLSFHGPAPPADPNRERRGPAASGFTPGASRTATVMERCRPESHHEELEVVFFVIFVPSVVNPTLLSCENPLKSRNVAQVHVTIAVEVEGHARIANFQFPIADLLVASAARINPISLPGRGLG